MLVNRAVCLLHLHQPELALLDLGLAREANTYPLSTRYKLFMHLGRACLLTTRRAEGLGCMWHRLARVQLIHHLFMQP